MKYQPTELQQRLADPSLSLCPLGRKCPDYDGTAPRHVPSQHRAAEVAVYNVTAVQVAKQSAAYRTVRFGAVSIREVKAIGVPVKYSVRAPVTARRLPSGAYVCGERRTVIYDDQSEVAAVVNAQHHIQPELPPRQRRALPGASDMAKRREVTDAARQRRARRMDALYASAPRSSGR